MGQLTLNDGQIFVGNGSNIGAGVTLSGDFTITNAGVASIGSGKVTNTMLAGSIAASKLVGTDIATVGTVTSGTWSATTIAINKGGTGQTTASAAFDALVPSQTGNSGKYLTTNGTTTSWGTVSGSGDFVGPGSSTDNAVVRFDGTTGKLGQNSLLIIDDNGSMSNTLSGGTTAGHIISNGTASAPIFQAKDNTTLKFEIQDGGFVSQTMAGSVSASNYSYLIDNTQTGNTATFNVAGVGNFGLFSQVYGLNNNSGAGNAAVVGYARTGLRTIGIGGLADGGGGSGSRNIGCYGYAAGNNSPSTAAGGYFEYSASNGGYTSALPTGIICALAASNLGSSADIVQFYDNTTVAFKIADGGSTQIGATSTTPKHAINSDTYTNASDALTLGNGPSGKAGDPAGYLKITINGTDRAIPYW